MIEFFHEIPVLGRFLLILVCMLLVLADLALLKSIWSSFRSWKFSLMVFLLIGSLCFGTIWAYSQIYPMRTVQVCEQPTEKPAPSQSPSPSPTKESGK